MLLPPRMFEITAAAKTTMMKLVFMSSSATPGSRSVRD